MKVLMTISLKAATLQQVIRISRTAEHELQKALRFKKRRIFSYRRGL